MQKKKLSDEELMGVTGGEADYSTTGTYICPSCGHFASEEWFYHYETGEKCETQHWRVCPKCQYHFQTRNRYS